MQIEIEVFLQQAENSPSLEKAQAGSWYVSDLERDSYGANTKAWERQVQWLLNTGHCVLKTHFKIMEHVIYLSLKWYLESKQLLVPQQAEFRQCNFTED